MQLIIAFTIGIAVGIVLGPKDFKITVTKEDKSKHLAPREMTQEEILSMIAAQDDLEKESIIEPLNEDDVFNSIDGIINQLFEEDEL